MGLNRFTNVQKLYIKNVKSEIINKVKVERVNLYPRKKSRLSIIRNYLSGELARGVSKKTLCRRLAALRHFFNYLLERGDIHENPYYLPHSP